MKVVSFCCLLLICLHWKNAMCQHVIHMSQVISHETGVSRQEFRTYKSDVNTVREFSFASYYGDHMVLQKAPQRAIVWGYHPDPGNRIIVQVKSRKIYSAIVDEQGTWKVLLEPESSAGPFSIVALSEGKAIHLNDVLFGDVWLCSGQSNMAFTLDNAINGSQEIAEAKYFQNIRVFTAERHFSKSPLSDLAGVAEPWSLPNNATLGHSWQYFSAICWLYGKYLYQRLGYPIGLIASSWGGTPIESWMSADALKKCGLKPQSKETGLADWDSVIEGESRPVTSEQDHGELWNAMINPFSSMTLYGVIWDQGENDAPVVSYRNNYNCTFPVMISDWRSKFFAASNGQTSHDFPFGFVQIGPSYKDAAVSWGVPDIRWHQTADYGYVPNPRMKNVFMSVSMDIADFNSPFGPVHTRDKQDIAHRLYLGGLSVAYNITTDWHGPLPVSITNTISSLVLDYGTAWTLELRQREGFDLCCSLNGSKTCQPEEGKASWIPTPIMTSNRTHIALYTGVCGEGQSILGLRYAWRLSPCPFKQCAVYSKDNSLPAPPFVAFPITPSAVEGTAFHFDWSKPVRV